MSRYFMTLTAASAALIAGLGGAVLAQDAAPTPTADLPAALSTLDLQNVEIKPGRRGGSKIEADLPGGGEIEAFVDDQNNLIMVDTDDVAVPQSLIDTLLPQSVRDNDILSQFSTIEKIGGREGRFMVGGQDANGEDLRAGFDEDGRLMRFGRGDDDERGHKGREGRGGHGKGEHGGKHGKGDHGRGGPKDGGPRDGGPRGAGDMPPPPPVDAAALNQALTGAGYSDLGELRPEGRRMLIDATNAAGESVTLEVDPAGEVIRETAR